MAFRLPVSRARAARALPLQRKARFLLVAARSMRAQRDKRSGVAFYAMEKRYMRGARHGAARTDIE